MKFNRLGNSGLIVSEVCLGTMVFTTHDSESAPAGAAAEKYGGLPFADEKTSFEILDAYVNEGGNFLDTADGYTGGESEACIGKWQKARSMDSPTFRDSLVIATKVWFPTGTGPMDKGSSRRHILHSVGECLARLQTNYIDLLYLHCWDKDTPIEETFSTLNSLVESGKVRYIGVSNFTGWQLAEATALCKANRWAPIVALQAQYSLLCRQIEWELVPYCKRAGIAILPWSPLAGGWLTGRYQRSLAGPPEGSRVEWAEKIAFDGLDWSSRSDQTWDTIEALKTVAESAELADKDKNTKSVAVGATSSQCALRWLLDKDAVESVIIGARTMRHLEDNLGCIRVKIGAEGMADLDRKSAVLPPYPYSFQKKFAGM